MSAPYQDDDDEQPADGGRGVRRFYRCEDCTTSVTCEDRDRCIFPDLEDGVPLSFC